MVKIIPMTELSFSELLKNADIPFKVKIAMLEDLEVELDPVFLELVKKENLEVK